MKRGIRRLVVVVAAIVGLGVAYGVNASTRDAYSSCLRTAYLSPDDPCFSLARPDWEECLKKTEARSERMVELCHQTWGGPKKHIRDPLMFGGFAFLGVALLLELVRLVGTWVIAGFRR